MPDHLPYAHPFTASSATSTDISRTSRDLSLTNKNVGSIRNNPDGTNQPAGDERREDDANRVLSFVVEDCPTF